MLTQLPSPKETSRNLRRERSLWHDTNFHTPCIGCPQCHDYAVCGGLQLPAPLYNCLSFCCQNPQDCDSVCRNNPEKFVQRVREVEGFLLDNVPRNPVLPVPALPPLVPLIYHGSRRTAPFRASAVCLPLYSVIERHNGEARYSTAEALARGFALHPDVPIMLTGTASDAPLERWWSLGPQRRERIRALRRLGIALVTSPNYSLFVDQPRWDDLHSMKRIAIVHEEFLCEGLPAALHLNARTQKDWERVQEFVAARPEITHVAFEFATGAGWADRAPWHADKLARLAAGAGRPLHLILRGGGRLLPVLARAFTDITLVETSVFMKTQSRQRAFLSAPGVLGWRSSPTKRGETVDALLRQNWAVVTAAYEAVLNQRLLPLQACG
jgi:hypothetical protein